MAITTLDNAIEQSTYVVTLAFTDENDDSLTPKTVTWTLTDVSGTVINSREDIPETPAESVSIVLSGDDLAIIAGVTNKRILTAKATYDSDFGSDLPLNGRAEFTIENLIAI